MNCSNMASIAFCLFFNLSVMGGEVAEKNIGFIQDNRGRKWSVFKDIQNTMFAQRENEKVKVALYIQYATSKLSNHLYVLYLDKNQIQANESSLISSAISLDS